jgi:hypothetical protein
MRQHRGILLSFLLLILFSLSAEAVSPQYSEEKQNLVLRWKTGTIPISVSSSLLKLNLGITNGSDVEGAIKRSLETWEKAADIKFEVLNTDEQTVSPKGNFGDGVSLITNAPIAENLLLFESDTDVSARTRVFFNKKGIITEADIVLNPYQQFSTDGTFGTFDLESILTHEIGHLLGLEHSFILGATMHESNGKNGVFNLKSFDSRTLAETDVSAIRALYGANAESGFCCGKINGRLIFSDLELSESIKVWAEDVKTGKIAGAAAASPDGSFQIEGLSSGKYRIFARIPTTNQALNKSLSRVEEIGITDVPNGDSANLIKILGRNKTNFELQYIGFSGQLSEESVPLNAGKSYEILVGGKNIDKDVFKIGFNSPFLSIVPGTIERHDYGENLSVLGFHVKVDSKIPFGEYSLYFESGNGSKSYILGGLTIEKFENASFKSDQPEN